MKYAAFFKGLNAGGHNIVKMADLKALFSDLGFSAAESYIQSGNIVFSADIEASDLINSITAAFEQRLGFKAPVVIRTIDEIQEIIKCRPFSDEDIAEADRHNPDVEHLYVFLFESPVNCDDLKKFTENIQYSEKFYLMEREILFLTHNSIRDSKAAAALARMKIPQTSRNMNTMNKIWEMMSNL